MLKNVFLVKARFYYLRRRLQQNAKLEILRVVAGHLVCISATATSERQYVVRSGQFGSGFTFDNVNRMASTN